MAFKPNDSRINRQGRPRETKYNNKDLKQLFRKIIEQNTEHLAEHLNELTLRDRINLLKILTPYVLPKLNVITERTEVREQPLFLDIPNE
jgi:rubrerythrin